MAECWEKTGKIPVTVRWVDTNKGEPGEMVGRIDKGHPVRDFHGYSDNSSTKKKIMTDVFKKGDLYFR